MMENRQRGRAFVDGWRVAYPLATAFVLLGLFLTFVTRPPREESER